MSNDKKVIDLYELLPAIYRIRDAQHRYPLRALLDIISGQADMIKQHIDGLWDDLFIETCADWVIPYIGNLVGNNPLHEVIKSPRADVAKTIYYRRRKGTLPVLEELGRDMTGWGCHTVEFFELLGWTQNTNHRRYEMTTNPDESNPNATNWVGTVNLRNIDALDRLDGPFDIISHTIDVRPACQVKGWHNIRDVGFFLWRLQSYPMYNVQARRIKDVSIPYGYHFSPTGNPIQLFTNPRREAEEAGLATELHVPGRIRPAAFYYNVSDYYGDPAEDRSIRIFKDDSEVSGNSIVYKSLRAWSRPATDKVGVDVRRGRIVFGEDMEPLDPENVRVSFHYGFSADVGGGQYTRAGTLKEQEDDVYEATVRHDPNPAQGEHGAIADALGEWYTSGKRKGIIHIADSWTYRESITIVPPSGGYDWLAIEADDNQRPVLSPPIEGRGEEGELIGIAGNHSEASLIINGLVIEGAIKNQAIIGKIQLIHCTLIPGLALSETGEPIDRENVSVLNDPSNADHVAKDIEIDHSIVGALRLSKDIDQLTIRDSIVDGLNNASAVFSGEIGNPDSGPPVQVERSTILGNMRTKELVLASEVIFTGKVISERTQQGCVRFSYIPRDSQTPRRFYCQPDLAIKRAKESKNDDLTQSEKEGIVSKLQPAFISRKYGQPGYCQLGHNCAVEIKTGAEFGSEMGVFQHLLQPQRETNLRIRLKEYLPFGLNAGFIYVT